MAHITRFETPWFLVISKKQYKWTVRPNAGPHPIGKSIPLAVVIRDYLKLAGTVREAKHIIFNGKVLVDGKVRKDYKYPVGLMDIVSIPSADLYFRVLPDNVRFMRLSKISADEAHYKYVRIMNKTTIKGGGIQLNLEDGRNILVDKETAKNFKTLMTLKIELPSQNIVDSFTISEGSYAIFVGGKNVGIHGVVKNINLSKFKSRKYSVITLESKGGNTYQTNLMNVMSIGREKPDMRVD
ncbi:MAG: 30S ribosomal protein S4e [Saccharolobus sp.]|uniref:Small ribosomal subunit protein eS4 n=2 Tax=Saccharolobus TaxID=2100760 RepID=A0A8F5C387_9CREN|nr:30S ribosomal protein S4e [Saccharolobus shibatae]MCH4814916.1 30S ribosomal protein S4e [Saccharolobus shibatae]QXJ36171.1 SSU ribosomal protein S4e [Saccharolobus shibatae]